MPDINAQQVLLPPTVFASMIGVGVELQWQQFRAIARTPRIPLLGTLIHTCVFPALAVSLVSLVVLLKLPLSEPLLAGILLIAACPSGGFSNILVLVARADLVLSVVLTTVSSLLSFFTVPLFVTLFGYLLPAIAGTVSVPIGETLMQLLVLVVLPVGAGMLWRHRFPDFVIPRIGSIQKWTQVALYAAILSVLYQQSDTVLPAIPATLPWALGLCVAALATGFLVSRVVGLSSTDAATIAIEGSIRNLAVAFLVAVNVLNRVDIAVLPTVYFGAVLIVGLGFAHLWRRRGSPRIDPTPNTS
ncbi:MAG: bile acid:sodium symporter [Pseudomonadales bacterium]|nr:bile acid:sodium symporter [Pseudomonadales bacterium]